MLHEKCCNTVLQIGAPLYPILLHVKPVNAAASGASSSRMSYFRRDDEALLAAALTGSTSEAEYVDLGDAVK